MRNLHEAYDDLQQTLENSNGEDVKKKKADYEQEKRKSNMVANATNKASANLRKIESPSTIIKYDFVFF